jgi:hypothetical protein
MQNAVEIVTWVIWVSQSQLTEEKSAGIAAIERAVQASGPRRPHMFPRMAIGDRN